MSKLLDANAILRFLLNDIPEQADLTAKIIYEGAFTKEVVIAEVVYVLNGVYNLSRNQISRKLEELFEIVDIDNFDVVKQTINLYANTKLDFVDCLLISYNKISGIDIFSFDKKLNNQIESLR